MEQQRGSEDESQIAMLLDVERARHRCRRRITCAAIMLSVIGVFVLVTSNQDGFTTNCGIFLIIVAASFVSRMLMQPSIQHKVLAQQIVDGTHFSISSLLEVLRLVQLDDDPVLMRSVTMRLLDLLPHIQYGEFQTLAQDQRRALYIQMFGSDPGVSYAILQLIQRLQIVEALPYVTEFASGKVTGNPADLWFNASAHIAHAIMRSRSYDVQEPSYAQLQSVAKGCIQVLDACRQDMRCKETLLRSSQPCVEHLSDTLVRPAGSSDSRQYESLLRTTTGEARGCEQEVISQNTNSQIDS